MTDEAKVMSAQEASALEREAILNAGNPDYVLPDGRKNSDVWLERADRDEADRREAREFMERSIAANTPRVESVSVRVTPDGQPISTVESVRPAETEDRPATDENETVATAAVTEDGASAADATDDASVTDTTVVERPPARVRRQATRTDEVAETE